MNRRQFLQRLALGGACCVAAPLLAKLPFPVPHKIKFKFYPWCDSKGEAYPLHPDNIAVRAETDRMISSFKTPEEYAAIFGRASYHHSIGNDAEAGYAARKASRLLTRKWYPPKEVLGLSCMLTAYGIRYSESKDKGKEGWNYAVPCGKHPSP